MNEPKQKYKSFRLNLGILEPVAHQAGFGDITKKEFWQFKKMSKNEYRNAASACFLLGFIMPVLFLVGAIIAIVWIYKVVRKQG